MAELTLLSGRYERAPRRPPAVVATKLRPPALPPAVVPRPRLLHLLDEGAGRALTLVVAPVGYGKTTLLAQWAAARSRPVAWISLDERDRDPFRLWAHVAAAFAGAVPELEGAVCAELPLGTLVPRLAEAAAAGPRCALVLDDHHRLGRGASEATLRWFAEQTAPAVQVVVAGRAAPPVPLGLMRARGELLEVGPERLRLSDPELRAVAGRLGVPVPDDLDGWPAGPLLRSRPGALERVAVEALAALPGEERRFLVEASVLARLDGESCDAVLRRTGSQALLRAVERGSPFLVSTANGYRLHRAFAPALEQRAADPAQLHLRAAALLRPSDPGAALEHALAAGDTRAAAALLRRTWRADAGNGRHELALARLERLPDEALDARLELARAWLLHLGGRRDEALAALASAEGKAAPRALPLVRAQARLVEAAFCWAGPRRAAAGGAFGAWAAGWGHWWRGRDAAAEPLLERAAAGPPLLAAAATSVRSRIAGARGDRERAERLAREAVEHGFALGMAETALGAALAARGRAADAAASLEEGLRLRRAWGHPLELVDALLVLAPVAARLDGRPRAADLLAEARAVLDECGDPGSLGPRLEEARRRALPRPGAPAGPELTERELGVLRLLAAGATKREIAAELRLSVNTVHSHTKSIYRKLDASTRAQTVARAVAEGLC